MKTNKHTKIEAQLAFYRELTTTEKAQVDQHLAQCPACAATLARYAQQDQWVTRFVEQRQHALARTHTQPTYQQLLDAQTQKPSWLASWQYRYWPALQRQQPRFALALTCVALLVVMAAMLRQVGSLVESLALLTQPTPAPTVTPIVEEGTLAAARRGIEQALALEMAARNGDDLSALATYIDPTAEAAWRALHQRIQFPVPASGTVARKVTLTLVDVTVEGDIAQATVTTTSATDHTFDSAEGRFYRRVGDQWLLTSPDKADWGATQVITTPSFHIEVRALDAATVEAAAPQLEAAYARLLLLLTLPGEQPIPVDAARQPYFYEGKLHIVLVPENVDSGVVRDKVLLHTSPFLSLRPQNTSAADFLTYMLLAHVGTRAIHAATEGASWQAASIEQWLLEESINYQLWGNYMVGQTHEFLAEKYPLKLMTANEHPTARWIIVTGNLLMGYIADAYGDEAIPAFVRGLATYDNWEKLTPALFDLTPTEFEAGWNQWLLAEYPAHAQRLEVSAAIEASLVVEAEARATRNAELLPHYVDPEANAGWQSVYRATNILYPREFVGYGNPIESITYTLHLEQLQIVDDVARARVQISYSDSRRTANEQQYVNSVFLEDRFYRHVDGRWLLTSPVEELLGDSMVQESEHFRIQYHSTDAELVNAALPELERAYQQLLTTLSLPAMRPVPYAAYQDGKFNFQIVPYAANSFNLNNVQAVVASPYFDRIPPYADPARHLSYNLFQALVNPLIDERLDPAIDMTWGNVTRGMRMWITEDSQLTWSGSDPMMGRGMMDEMMANAYPLRLAEIDPLDYETSTLGIGYAIMAFTVDTYGLSAIVPLLQTMERYATLEEVVPAVYFVSLAEFETALNAWLAEDAREADTTLPAIYCTDPNSQITSPGNFTTVKGEILLRGTARMSDFAYYQVEIAHGANATEGFSLVVGGSQPKEENILGFLDTSALSPAFGPYTLRLTVVDRQGNTLPPCRITITVEK